MSELVLLPAVRQLELLRAKAVSVTELADAHITQIERLNPKLNAFADFDAERVRAAAREKDAWTGLERRRPPLLGLPVTVKSSIATRGFRCEIGSLIHKGGVPSEDAEVVRRLRSAGALILGTTNCPEFLMNYETDNLLHGRTNNPWDLTRTPGGSSGGEAAAIAAGMSACGLGSDSGGSVRIPAHFTGICSLKPTPGRVPGRGHLPPCVGPFSTLGAIGPMARTIADLTMLFRLLSGQDLGDPLSARVLLKEPGRDELPRRIGVFEDDGLAPVTMETRAAVQAAAQALREAGFHVETFRPKTLEKLRALWWKFFVQCGAMLYAPVIAGREDELSPMFKEFLGVARKTEALTANDLLFAWAELDLVRAEMLEEMRYCSVLLCPVASVPAFKHGERAWQIDWQRVEYLDAWRYAQWFNALGAPAVVVPVGDSVEGMPIGVQVVARPYEDEVALAVAGIVDQAFGYRAPGMASG